MKVLVPSAVLLTGPWGDLVWNGVKFFPLLRLPEFLIGVATGVMYLRRSPEPNPLRGYLVGGAVLAFLATGWAPALVQTVMFAPAFALLIYSLAGSTGWLASRPLVLLGGASYSLYLLHFPLAYWVGGWSWAAASVVLSVLVFRYFEEPLRKRLRSKELHTERRLRPVGVVSDIQVSS